MTIKQIEEHDSGFGFFLDRELTIEVPSMNFLKMAGEARVKKVRLFFGNPNLFGSLIVSANKEPIVISSSTHPEEAQNLGHYILAGVHNAVEMWFSVDHDKETEISITAVRWS